MKILKKTLTLINQFLKVLLLLLIFNFSLFAKPSNLQVIDGDTIKFNKKKFRLYGIDAPEINQKCKINGKDYFCGRKSKDFLEAKILGKEISCLEKDKDRYKRIIAICYLQNQDLNKMMVKNGWALAYRRYSSDYIRDEIYAKQNNLGIWKGEFMEPSKWRRFYK
ncbi:MAG: hypothetical protein CFH30_00803 [Alphaproteobacteria bacterium MarineAlpha8_Bin1]|nr:MAG: hypothetical protein CFH30_00803 [Alphaproteobacteria bacterium MarineAlpha8_Bin1]